MGIGNATTEKKQHRCHTHSDRIAAAVRSVPLCWECLLGTDDFNKRFSPGFYDPSPPDCPAPAGADAHAGLAEQLFA